MRKQMMRTLVLAGLGFLASGTTGCAGQLKSAALEHAKATRTVADTLTKSAAAIKCDGSKDADGCTAAVSVINDQAKTLRDSADNLERAAQ